MPNRSVHSNHPKRTNQASPPANEQTSTTSSSQFGGSTPVQRLLQMQQSIGNRATIQALQSLRQSDIPATQSDADGSAVLQGKTAQLKRHKKQLNPKQEASRARIMERRARRLKPFLAEQNFYKATQSAGAAINPNAFPFDGMQHEMDNESVLERLPADMRNSDSFKKMLELTDADHGEQSEKRTSVTKGALQEVMGGWQFGRERGLDMDSITSGGQGIDFKGKDSTGRTIPFDPFMSPQIQSQNTADRSNTAWAQDHHKGSYYKHTHGKGGNPNTVGVWDKTYTTPAHERELKSKLQTSGADQGANVHELRVPLARMYAMEHIAAEAQIKRRAEEKAKAEQEARMEKQRERNRKRNRKRNARKKRKKEEEM